MTARVLVVDDLLTNRTLLELKLQAEYYEVGVAASGEEALDLAERWSPDVILLDVMMPGLDGYEVCRRLKTDDALAHIPVVMVTALVDPAERLRGLEAGADDFLSKPVDDPTLFARLRALLRVKQVQDAWRLRAVATRALGIEPPAEPPSASGEALGLVVTGDAAEAAAIGHALAAEGIATEAVADAEAAQARLCGGGGGITQVDLALLCLAPGAGGEALRLASRLRAQMETREVPMLLVADPAQRPLVLRGFDLGANDHVLRPVDPNELRARARNQIRRKRYQDRLRGNLDHMLALAVTDPLTGLRNRRYVLHHLDALLRGSDAAVLLIDVDRFKLINDGFGHAAGDTVLCQVADRLRAHLPDAEIIARYGGEEFLAGIAADSAAQAERVADRLRDAIGAPPFVLGERRIAVTASIGIAVARRGTSAQALIDAADAALYRAKALGRNRVEVAPVNHLDAEAAPGGAPAG
jgi:two-component system, cell cycle response regulator